MFEYIQSVETWQKKSAAQIVVVLLDPTEIKPFFRNRINFFQMLVGYAAGGTQADTIADVKALYVASTSWMDDFKEIIERGEYIELIAIMDYAPVVFSATTIATLPTVYTEITDLFIETLPIAIVNGQIEPKPATNTIDATSVTNELVAEGYSWTGTQWVVSGIG